MKFVYILLIFTLTICFLETTQNPVNYSSGSCGKRVVGYYTSWLDRYITEKQAKGLTHVIFAFFHMDKDGKLFVSKKGTDDENSLEMKKLKHLMDMRKVNPELKIMFAVGGWENSQHFSNLCSNDGSMQKFVDEILRITHLYGFDGVDVDWEYPTTGGSVEGIPADKQNYVTLMRQLREAFNVYENKVNRVEKLLISFAGAAGEWTLDPGFDLSALKEYVNFMNIMSYDYFGAWESKWGAYTGPPAPLYHGSLKTMSGKMNVDWTMKYYYCKVRSLQQLNMGIPFYGRFWNNVGEAIDSNDDMWRLATKNADGKFEGGHIQWRELMSKANETWKTDEAKFHEKTRVPYVFRNRKFLSYENPRSIKEKMMYTQRKGLGGVMIWAIEYDDDKSSLLETVNSVDLCEESTEKGYKCSPLTEKRWWTADESDEFAGMCGKSAPLYNGFYPVCDSADLGYSCCGRFGYCGTGTEYCDCSECVNYAANPKMVLVEPIKPTTPIRWYTNAAPQGKRGRCGRNSPLREDGSFAICNPDDNASFCCSNAGYCGSTKEHCECDGCVNFKINPTFKYVPITWWTYAQSSENSGKCGKNAPILKDGTIPTCNPESLSAHCCSISGWCGTGKEYCECENCVDFKKNPDFKFT
uniref:GH18 domain-containing protein n=1 Tax=Rhabditophanes sp. KR3021 TaxID=114890 RepID=A0AC35U694_9BILA